MYDSEEEEKCQYRIVLPFSKQYDTSIDCASCLSPLGKSLLFKNVNDNVSVQILRAYCTIKYWILLFPI
ncbi:GreA/GreB family elongation factor [Acetivibrio straminisolvens]|uniref:GreA/GreB family elongation factor n=1 Tax=Acetivibrio straminisolvens TaxID=253314 RepID=UPI001FB0C902|nr:GreA/GreB family elongation factor [Acetivibrio straminisolvens]